jgi:glutaredoxin
MLLDKVRAWVGDALSSKLGEHYKPVRMAREALATANDLLGRPFRTSDELAARKAANGHGDGHASKREAAPVMVYFDGKDHRTRKKIEELLKGREIRYQVLDVTDDESTRSWAITQAKQTEFPLVFVAGEAIGGLHELTQADVNGVLTQKVFG